MPPVPAGSLPPRSLLLIDDSRDYCTLVERAFHQVQPGLAVFPLSDGQRAIAVCGAPLETFFRADIAFAWSAFKTIFADVGEGILKAFPILLKLLGLVALV